MNKHTLFGEGYSHLIPLLLFKKGNGIVHSRFTNGLNIKMGDSLIFIGTTKNGFLPFGIHLNERDTALAVFSVNNGEAVSWNERTNSIEFQNFMISLDRANPFKNEISELKNDQVFESSFTRFSTHLMSIEERTGLDVSIRDFINNYKGFNDQDTTGIDMYLMLLIKAAITSDESLMDKAFRYFLGRGNGLTPSGDDMIVGLLAFDAVTHFLSTRFYDKLSELIENESITTDVAKEYLRYAVKQEYSSTVSDMVNTLANGENENFEKDFQNLLGVGHSSGLDTLFGILIGMLSFKTKKTN
ncbi:DUF2877 domain-containing protein [Ureibacillus acetophenoni]|uniref:Uncharacterized protein DUF2877 n=1 Tax=Ureibacillus acetophenoni TaxID=614649 RepID=A0A285UL53_9BACL|nr:DUF2877 domain-containing protein [Ureibacillus acetophenoni]SOC42493.1 uncharacterized protein DUF2877 [Ureibacillus acetophenoni]